MSASVCVTSAITPTAARKRTFRHFAFVPKPDVASLMTSSQPVVGLSWQAFTQLSCSQFSAPN
jgi:hypothetical protein